MGLIRTLLAISVLIKHSGPIFGLKLTDSGDMAVICFFMISGFLMALILTDKYSSIRSFYENRILRIYPPYFFAVVLCAVVYFYFPSGHHDPIKFIGRLSDHWDVLAIAAVTNLTLIGIEITRYLNVTDAGQLLFPNFAHPGGVGSHNLLFVPQAWTLGLELQFYLLAPILVRWRAPFVAALIVLSVLLQTHLKHYLDGMGLRMDDAAFFPVQIQYFLMGVLGFKLYDWLRAVSLPDHVKRVASHASFALALAMIFVGRRNWNELGFTDDQFYYVFAVLLPFVFYAHSGGKIDKWIGDLSYPVYLNHYAFAKSADMWVGEAWLGEATLAFTLAVSIVFEVLIDRPLQRYRALVYRRNNPTPPEPESGRRSTEQETLPTPAAFGTEQARRLPAE